MKNYSFFELWVKEEMPEEEWLVLYMKEYSLPIVYKSYYIL